MTTARIRTVVRTAAACCGGTALLLLAQPAASAVTTSYVANGDFQTNATDGSAVAVWSSYDFGTETAPYSASINDYDANGQYPPPTGEPGGNAAGNFACENFYDVGSAIGVEGFGGQETFASPIAGSTDPMVSWSDAPTFLPSTSSAAWAGSAIELDLTSGAGTYELIYVDPDAGSYSSTPSASDTSTIKYVALTTVSKGTWNTEAPRDVASDVSAQFGLSSFTITKIAYVNAEDATSQSPYPNMSSYWKNISLTSGSGTTGGTGPTSSLPETPLMVGLPAAALVVLGGGAFVVRRRRAG